MVGILVNRVTKTKIKMTSFLWVRLLKPTHLNLRRSTFVFSYFTAHFQMVRCLLAYHQIQGQVLSAYLARPLRVVNPAPRARWMGLRRAGCAVRLHAWSVSGTGATAELLRLRAPLRSSAGSSPGVRPSPLNSGGTVGQRTHCGL